MRKVLCSVLILLMVFITPIFCYADNNTVENITDLQTQRDELKNQIDETQSNLNDVQSGLSENLQQVEKLDSRIDTSEQKIEEQESKITDLKSSISDIEKDLDEVTEKYDKQTEIFKERLVTMYEDGDTHYLDILLKSKDISDFLSSYFLISQISELDNNMIEELSEKKEQIDQSKQKLENEKQELATILNNQTIEKTTLENTKKVRESFISKLSDKEKELQKQIDELREHENEVNSKILELAQQYDSESISSYGFVWPVKNPRIGTGYGVAGNMWGSGHHTGLDFVASEGTPVYSVGDGIVVDAYYSDSIYGAYGNFVEIYHGNNIYSFYAHASSILVSIGDKVTRGQQIMYSGHTGNTTGPHLHFEIRTPGSKYADCVNPLPYLVDNATTENNNSETNNINTNVAE